MAPQRERSLEEHPRQPTRESASLAWAVEMHFKDLEVHECTANNIAAR